MLDNKDVVFFFSPPFFFIFFSSPIIQNFPKTVRKNPFNKKDEWVDRSVVLFSYREEEKKGKKKKEKEKNITPPFCGLIYLRVCGSQLNNSHSVSLKTPKLLPKKNKWELLVTKVLPKMKLKFNLSNKFATQTMNF